MHNFQQVEVKLDVASPFVSIGLPVYNGAKYLRRALDSLLAQDYQNFELIISDNASTDETGSICQAYAAQDKRIKLYHQPHNLGAFNNFNFVLQNATGYYFMWAAHDDWWAPTFISDLICELEHNPQESVAMSAVELVCEDGTVRDVFRFIGDDLRTKSHLRLAINTLVGQNQYYMYIYGIFRRDFVLTGFQDFPRVMQSDRLFICQVALATRMGYVDKILHHKQIVGHIPSKYPNSDISKLYADPWALEKRMIKVAPYLLKSQVVPLSRKVYVPVLLMASLHAYLYSRIGPPLAKLAGKILGIERRRILGRFYRALTKKIWG